MIESVLAGKTVWIGRVGNDLVVVETQTWENQKQAGIATLRRLEPGLDAEQAVLQAIYAPEFWLGCLLDEVPGVHLLPDLKNEQHVDLSA